MLLNNLPEPFAEAKGMLETVIAEARAEAQRMNHQTKRPRGRPRKYETREQLLEARRKWAADWREANPERWRLIQQRADAKRRKFHHWIFGT